MKKVKNILVISFVMVTICVSVRAQSNTVDLITENGGWRDVRARAVVTKDGCFEVTADSGNYGWVSKKMWIDPAQYSRLEVGVRRASGVFNIKILNLKGDGVFFEVLRTREAGQHIFNLPFSDGEKSIQIAIYLTGGNVVKFNEIRLLP